jgi:hypothetical protein
MPKSNLRLISKSITNRLKSLSGRPIIAACSRVYTAEELAAGKLRHLGVEISNGKVSHPKAVIPPDTGGKYSYRNVNGEEIVRKDLPKETHYNSVESPNWGDSYNGTHTVDLPYEKYPRDFIGPRLTQIKISTAKPASGQSTYMIVFEVDRVLNQKKKDFDNDLLICLNLLQENVGFCGVQGSDATLADYLQTLTVSWEVLPPGTREEAVARIFRGRIPSAKEKADVEERYDFLMSLQPAKLVYGTSGLQRYFGGLLKDDLVVFENIQYGNAIYIMFEDWKELSQRTRTELLSGRYGTNFERIMHASGWKGQVRAIVKKRLSEKKGKG